MLGSPNLENKKGRQGGLNSPANGGLFSFRIAWRVAGFEGVWL